MTGRPISDDSPGAALFPEYASLYPLIASEVEGLTEGQLDFTSDRWGWAEWSIRVQLSHMASLIYRWLLLRWGDTLFPDGDHGVEDVQSLADSGFDRRLDDNRYWELPVIMEKLEQGIGLARRVLAQRNVGFLWSHTLLQDQSPQWDLMIKAHPRGIEPSDQPGKGVMRLEASMRHIYFEEITHLFNIQRLKRAQGLSTVAELPRVGYWTVEGWDVSEP
jgi:hypothetical protein